MTKTKSASELLEGWRDKAENPQVKTKYLLLERSCREMMELYGYNRVMELNSGYNYRESPLISFDPRVDSVDLNWTLHL